MFRFAVLLIVVAAAQAQYIAQHNLGYHGGIITPSITHQNNNILRSYGNLGQVATQSKSIHTPYSSVHKSDVRVSNPGYAVHAAPAYHHGYAGAIAAPAYHHGYAAPVVGKALAPAGLLGVAYSAAPAVAHMSYSNGLGLNYAW